MNASIKTIKRSSAARLAARRAAHWSVLVAALGQTACDEDADPWDIADGGLDASVVADASVDSTSSASRGGDSTVLGSGDVTVIVDGTSTGDSDAPDASVGASSDGESTSTLALSTSGDVATSETSGATGTSDTSGATASETSGATATSDAPDTAEGESTRESTSSDAPVDETSTSDVPTSDATDGETTDGETTDGESTGEPPTVVCGHTINPAEGISLQAALANYTPPGEGDGGVNPDCYPPCIAALLAACPIGNSCTTPDYVQVCWDNDVSQVEEFSDDYNTLTERAYIGSAPCITGQAVNTPGASVTYTWWDGTGAVVAHGEGAGASITVTCEDNQEPYAVDTALCPWLGQALYDPFSCY